MDHRHPILRALRRMISTLRPGGWLLIEDFDVDLLRMSCLDPQVPAEHRANRIRDGFVNLLAARGVDLRYGRRLPSILREAGLTEVMADAYFPVAHPATAALEGANVAQVRDGLIGQGHATAEEVDEHLAALGDLDLATPPLFAAWGRRVGGRGSAGSVDAGRLAEQRRAEPVELAQGAAGPGTVGGRERDT